MSLSLTRSLLGRLLSVRSSSSLLHAPPCQGHCLHSHFVQRTHLIAPNSTDLQLNSLITLPSSQHRTITAIPSDQVHSSEPEPSTTTSASLQADGPTAGPFSPLYGLPVRHDLPEYTYDEVDRHNRYDSYWIVLDSHVYDITHYASKHPGGNIESIFSFGHGTDVGQGFSQIHSRKQKYATKKFLIGRIKPGSRPNRIATPRYVATLELPDEPLTEVILPITGTTSTCPFSKETSSSNS